MYARGASCREFSSWMCNPNFTRRMAIANGTCVSFCNQPKAHYLATSRIESRRYVVAFSRFAGTAAIWLRQESLRHILASPEYASGTIVVNVTLLRCSSPHEGMNKCRRCCGIKWSQDTKTVKNQSLATDISLYLKWLKIDGYMLRGVWQGPSFDSCNI